MCWCPCSAALTNYLKSKTHSLNSQFRDRCRAAVGLGLCTERRNVLSGWVVLCTGASLSPTGPCSSLPASQHYLTQAFSAGAHLLCPQRITSEVQAFPVHPSPATCLPSPPSSQATAGSVSGDPKVCKVPTFSLLHPCLFPLLLFCPHPLFLKVPKFLNKPLCKGLVAGRTED